jgi:hypothetical protein
MAETDLFAFLKLAELPVKTLLIEYFQQFLKDDLLDFCEKYEISTSRVPKNYIELAEMFKLIKSGDLPKSMINKDSLLSLPKEQDFVKLMSMDNKIYHLQLSIVDTDIKWNAEVFQPFHQQVNDVKKEVGNIMNTALFVFSYLKIKYPEMQHLILETDPSNVTLILKDRIIPKYKHPHCIHFSMNLME